MRRGLIFCLNHLRRIFVYASFFLPFPDLGLILFVYFCLSSVAGRIFIPQKLLPVLFHLLSSIIVIFLFLLFVFFTNFNTLLTLFIGFKSWTYLSILWRLLTISFLEVRVDICIMNLLLCHFWFEAIFLWYKIGFNWSFIFLAWGIFIRSRLIFRTWTLDLNYFLFTQLLLIRIIVFLHSGSFLSFFSNLQILKIDLPSILIKLIYLLFLIFLLINFLLHLVLPKLLVLQILLLPYQHISLRV